MPVDPHRPLETPPQHRKVRTGLRIAGVTLMVIGVVLLMTGFTGFVSAFVNTENPTNQPNFGQMLLMIPGLLMVGIGAKMCLLGWAGSIAKYGVREGAPAAAEGVNLVGMGATPGIKAIATAVGAGLREDRTRVACQSCGDLQLSDARFCDGCGAGMGSACPSCGTTGEALAKFCTQCGASLN